MTFKDSVATYTGARDPNDSPIHPEEGTAGASKLLQALLEHVDNETCRHEDTYRGGAIWTICRDCDRKWADDEGGFVPYEDAPAVAAARAFLASATTITPPEKWVDDPHDIEQGMMLNPAWLKLHGLTAKEAAATPDAPKGEPTPAVMVDMSPPATSRDRWMYEQGRLAERVDCCTRIKAADDAAADGDYMLDSNDCISVLRGTWKGPLANDCPTRPSDAPASVERAGASVKLQEAHSIILAMHRDIIDYGRPQAEAKQQAVEFLRELHGWPFTSTPSREERLAQLRREIAGHLAEDAPKGELTPSDENMVSSAYRLHGYRQGTAHGIAFNRGARWMRSELASSPDAPKGEPTPAERLGITRWSALDHIKDKEDLRLYVEAHIDEARKDWAAPVAPQPAQQEGARCAECAKKGSDGWALYCVECALKFSPAFSRMPPPEQQPTEPRGPTDERWMADARETLDRLSAFLQAIGAPHAVDWREWIDNAEKHVLAAQQAPQPMTEPPLLGRWHHGEGHLVSGTIRIARWDCDTNPPTSFRDEVLEWVCDTLNAAIRAYNRAAIKSNGDGNG